VRGHPRKFAKKKQNAPALRFSLPLFLFGKYFFSASFEYFVRLSTSLCCEVLFWNFVTGCFYRARSKSFFPATTPSRRTGSAYQKRFDLNSYSLHGLSNPEEFYLVLLDVLFLPVL
jgi:transposase